MYASLVVFSPSLEKAKAILQTPFFDKTMCASLFKIENVSSHILTASMHALKQTRRKREQRLQVCG